MFHKIFFQERTNVEAILAPTEVDASICLILSPVNVCPDTRESPARQTSTSVVVTRVKMEGSARNLSIITHACVQRATWELTVKQVGEAYLLTISYQ